jgi:hypothetical protein
MMKEGSVQPVVDFKEIAEINKNKVLRLPQSRIPIQNSCYQRKGRRSSGRPYRRWRDAVTGHSLVLRRERLMTTLKECFDVDPAIIPTYS